MAVDFIRVGDTVQLTAGMAEVHAACTDRVDGYWHCASHRRSFRNEFDRDAHVHNGKHRVVWICWRHGAETP